MEQTEYAITELVAVRPGEPFRLLPFGRLVKGGRSWDITPEFARRFQLPHFKPPIKMGSHRDETPAVLRLRLAGGAVGRGNIGAVVGVEFGEGGVGVEGVAAREPDGSARA